MPLDILNKFLPKKGISLSLLILISQFLLLSLFGVAMLIVTYYSSRLVVESEQQQLQELSTIVGDLVLEKELESVEKYTDLLADELSVLRRSQQSSAQEFITGSFYSQEQGVIDFIAVLDKDGKIQNEISTEIDDFPVIRQKIETVKIRLKKWNWAVETTADTVPSNILLFYQSELINSQTGRVDGYLLSGIFLRDNVNLMQEILKRSNAITTALIFDGIVMVSAGKLNDESIVAYLNTNQLSAEIDATVIQSKVLSRKISGINMSILSVLPRKISQSLDQLYFLSSGIAFILIIVLSAFAIYLTRHQIILPLKQLTNYAREVGRRELNPKIPNFSISEFNEVGKNLSGVLQDFQEGERRFEDIVAIASDRIWETDKDHRYRFITRQTSGKGFVPPQSPLLGKRRNELEFHEILGMSWDDYFDILNSQKPFRNIHFKWPLKDGKFSYFSSSGRPRYDNKGNFIGYRGMSTNITSEIEAQQEIEIAQGQLRQSQKLEVVGQLTGGIAHDFNNLLSVVIGNLELALEDETLHDNIQKMLSDAMRGAEKGAALTHQLLAYSRQQALSPKRIKPEKVITDVRRLLQQAIGEGIEFKLQLEDSWSVMVDPNELENALMNLVVNARDAMEGNGTICIESFNIDLDEDYVADIHELEAGAYVCIVVSDDGSGIEADVIDRIFEPFFTTKEVGKGSGLGLSMVFGFAKQSGGHISIYSEIGKGTSIKLMLPRAPQDVENSEDLDIKEVVKLGNSETVLVVEDNIDLRKLVVSQLSSIGYKTVDCETGADALEILKSQPIDIVLSDVILPGGMTGVEIFKQVQKQYPHKSTLLMSGFAGNAFDKEKKLPLGAQILFKPFTKVKLSNALFDVRNAKAKLS